MKKMLNEWAIQKGTLLESNQAELPSGVLCRVKYNICNIGKPNRNGRIYERAVWEKVLVDKEIIEKMKNRCLYGHAEHPDGTNDSNTEKVSHIITDMYVDEKENKVYQVFEVLNTPSGRIIHTLLEAGCGIGVSTRAMGEVEEYIDEASKKKYERVIPELYEYITTDFTADPSTYETYPKDVEIRTVPLIKEAVEKNEISLEFASLLLEGMKTKEAKALSESVAKSLAECNKKSDEKDKEKKIKEEKVNSEEILVELKEAKKKIRAEEIEKHIAIAEREVISEEFKALEEKYIKDITEHTARINELEKSKITEEEIARIKYEFGKNLIKEMKENILKKVLAEKKEFEDKVREANEKVKEVKKELEQALSQKEKEILEKDKKIKGFVKRLKEMRIEKDREIAREYAKVKLDVLGLSSKLDEKTVQALLERCETRQDVEDMIEAIRNEIIEKTLHSEVLDEKKVTVAEKSVKKEESSLRSVLEVLS